MNTRRMQGWVACECQRLEHKAKKKLKAVDDADRRFMKIFSTLGSPV